MIQWVIENIRPAREHRFIFLCLAEHLESYPEVPRELERICPGCEIVPVPGVTEGAACTVLLARRLIDSEAPLMIANSDQIVELRRASEGHTLAVLRDVPEPLEISRRCLSPLRETLRHL